MSAGTSTVSRLASERHEQANLERALIRAFWQAVQQGGPMPIMAALETAARAVGTIYREAAAAHGPGGCGCGWEPDPDGDLIVLEAMLAAALTRAPAEDLASMAVAGRA